MSNESLLKLVKNLKGMQRDLNKVRKEPLTLPTILGDTMRDNLSNLLVAAGRLIEWSRLKNDDDELPDAADELLAAIKQVTADAAVTKVGGFDKTQLALIALHRAATGYRVVSRANGGDLDPELESYIRQADELMGLVQLVPAAK